MVDLIEVRNVRCLLSFAYFYALGIRPIFVILGLVFELAGYVLHKHDRSQTSSHELILVTGHVVLKECERFLEGACPVEVNR